MSGFLLDTYVISELVKPSPEPRVCAWIDAVEESSLYLSVLTLGEIRQGVARLAVGKRRVRLDRWLREDLPARFDGRILAVSAAVADRWGVLSARATMKGQPVPVIDGLLAATALCHDLILVTRNTADVAAAGVRVLNPWEATSTSPLS